MNRNASTPPISLDRPRRVLVVGATGRLGVSIAKGLVARGDHVALTARDPNKLDALADELVRHAELKHGAATMFPRPRVVVADLKHPDAPDLIASELQRTGGLDDIVLACGPFPRTPLETLTRADLLDTLTVHAIAPLLLVSALADDLAAKKGAVVALADAGVTRPYTNHVAYLTAKGALQAGLRALSVELAPHVRVNVISLGIVADPEADGDPLRTHRLAARSPLGRFGTAAEVTHAVLSLLDATWSTGEIWGIGR